MNLYIKAINEQSTNSVPVTTTVTAAYTAGSPTMTVQNAAVFFPNGSTAPVVATATSGNLFIGSFTFLGVANDTTLNVYTAASSSVSLSPGTILTSTVTPSARPAQRPFSPASLPIVPTRWPSTWCNISTTCR